MWIVNLRVFFNVLCTNLFIWDFSKYTVRKKNNPPVSRTWWCCVFIWEPSTPPSSEQILLKPFSHPPSTHPFVLIMTTVSEASLMTAGKESACTAETQEIRVQSLSEEDPPEKETATTPVFLPEKSQGQRSVAGCSPCMSVCRHAKSLQLCLTLCQPVDCSPGGL